MNVLLFGATGMVGDGVLHECLGDSRVDSVLAITRSPLGVRHPKLRELRRKDFLDYRDVARELETVDACFFCLGVSSVGMKEPEYYKLTYELTMNFAKLVSRHNPGMTFCYVSGASTDSTEKGRMMWARVKGKTENDLMKLPFKKAVAFRPGFMKPSEGQKNVLKAYKYVGWMFPLLRPFSPSTFLTLSEVGTAMINAAIGGSDKQVLETKDIFALAHRTKAN